MNFKNKVYETIKNQGLVPLDVLDRMTFEEMLKHLLTYTTTGEVWYPVHKVRS